MRHSFYSTGQAARELGTTQAQVRSLCENGVVAAETTPGGQWRVPVYEVERLKRDGLPPIPRPMPTEDDPPVQARHNGSELVVRPSTEVVSAQELVAITKATLERRRIERELEEAEDWFRERWRQEEAAAAVERQRAEAMLGEQRRQRWIKEWIRSALDSVPSSARQEVEIEVYTEVEAVLSKLQTNEPDSITRPLVKAAVQRALRPWQQKQDIKRAVETAQGKLPWEVRNRPEYASLMQRAWDAMVEALRRLRHDASYPEMATATLMAVQPMIREYEHGRECQRIVGHMYLFNATTDEQEAAKQALRKALAELPVGASRREFEKAEEAALTDLKTVVAQRKEAARLESERKTQRREAEWKVDLHLDHIERHLAEAYEFDGGVVELRREAERLRPRIREALTDELLKHPGMSGHEIRKRIETKLRNV